MQPPGGRRDNQSIPLGDRGLAGVPCVGSAVARAQYRVYSDAVAY
jgi:hypothetical protein